MALTINYNNLMLEFQSKEMYLLSSNSAVWDIYRVVQFDKAYVIRIPKRRTESTVEVFEKNYLKLIELKIPTVKIFARIKVDEFDAILTEDINYDSEIIYVTYNSINSETQRKVELLSAFFFQNKKSEKTSDYEEYRFSNKIVDILNFQGFLEEIITMLKYVSGEKYVIEFDSYFIGTQKNTSKSKLDYKIIDLDHIFHRPDDTYDKILINNIYEFYRALSGFIDYFIAPINRNIYLNQLKNWKDTYEP
ncbi:hypothetical protein D3C71_27470 [compost metagenome]